MEKELREFHEKHGFPICTELRAFDPASHATLLFASKVLKGIADSFEKGASKSIEVGDYRMLRAHLMVEELSETLAAMAECNHIEMFDGLCDLLYVTIGTAVTYGVPIEKGFAEVHRSNMTKPMRNKNDPRLRDKEGYEPADLESILTRGICCFCGITTMRTSEVCEACKERYGDDATIRHSR